MSPASDPSYPEDVRAALLAAARCELAEHGVGGISLRAIAQRAGVSRATPKWHFGDRAGLLSAVAVEGFRRLADDLRAAAAAAGESPAERLTALGRAYLNFGLNDAALFDLMFRSELLRRDDPALVAARAASYSVLSDTTGEITAREQLGDDRFASELSLLAWACVHGLVALVRDGALQAFTGAPTHAEAEQRAYDLADTFTNNLLPNRTS